MSSPREDEYSRTTDPHRYRVVHARARVWSAVLQEALGVQPACGFDACDSGSTDLLEQIDATVGQVVGGPFVVLQGETWHARWHPQGWSVGGQGRGPGADVVADLCRRLAEGESVRLPQRTEALVGRSWSS